MKRTINGQEFTRIIYTNNGTHASIETWYPTSNLAWLRERCDVQIVGS
jgi:hypothetical protein